MLEKTDKQYIEDLLVKYRNFEPFSALMKDVKKRQEKIDERITEHLDMEEKAHGELMEKIKAIEETMTKVHEVSEFIRTAGSVRRGFIWLASFVVAITGSIFGIKTIISWLK